MSEQQGPENDACVCHGSDRPHPPHLPCDMDCQPDWHRDGCAIYTSVYPPGVPTSPTVATEGDGGGR